MAQLRTYGGNFKVGGTLEAVGHIYRGVTTPQGALHIHDGVGGTLRVTKNTIIGASQTILPDATGDVTKLVVITGVATNGIPQAMAISGSIAPGGTLDVTADGGTNTLRFAVSAGGALTVIRQAGAATWSCTVQLVWQ